MKKMKSGEDVQHYVRPADGWMLTPEQTVATGITADNLSDAQPLGIVLKKFIDLCFFNYTSKNKSFCLVTFGDALLTRILPLETRDLNLKLPQSFYQYFDLLYEFKRFYPQSAHVQTIGDMLQYLQLKEILVPNLCQAETRSMIRIVNKLARDHHHFVAPRLLNQRHEPINKVRETAASRKQTYKRWSAYIRGRSPEPFKNPNREYVVRVRGLPYDARELEIMSFFKGIRIMEKNIAFLYSPEGKFTGEVYIRLLNQMDFREALSCHQAECHHRLIEVYESSPEDWTKALESRQPEKRETVYTVREELAGLPPRAGFVHVTSLAPQITEKDILGFFAHQKVVQRGVKRAIVGGRPSEEAFIVFADEASADLAVKYDGDQLGGRELKVTKKDRAGLEEFLNKHFIAHPPSLNLSLPPLPLEKRKTTLVMAGLPADVTREEVLTVFRGLNVHESELVFLSSPTGAFSGVALVPFEDESEAQKALKTRNLTSLRNRYIELFEPR